MTETEREDHEEFREPRKSSQEILEYRTENGMICREFPVKETHELICSEINFTEFYADVFMHYFFSRQGFKFQQFKWFTSTNIYEHDFPHFLTKITTLVISDRLKTN
ncbi:Calcium/calmodulin-dependent/calcium-dependent protein kinase [Artemisia annua]|uniref:Calcium/calmodulin-dependent/calcium-dependent protein kinase n=1 Tax=Artemisia annua TaxID=35608 RepID=A0A2U1LUZ8_ARTAN|nr:Calcium/calmodulin-dependent/calcium-dependent protein kinase [Artemisia annua]